MRLFRASVLAASACALALATSGCTGESAEPSSPAPSASESQPRPTPSAPASAAGTGCAPTENATPVGAVTRQTIDIDGDGQPDTEWIVDETGQIRFGVTTASGATFSYDVDTASPIAPAGFVSALDDERTISLLSDGRQASVHVIVDCSFVQPTNLQGEPYTFDLQNLRGHGTGVGCVDGSLVGLQARQTGAQFTVEQTVIELSADGGSARNGEASATEGLPADDPAVHRAQTVSCGDDSLDASGVSLQP